MLWESNTPGRGAPGRTAPTSPAAFCHYHYCSFLRHAACSGRASTDRAKNVPVTEQTGHCFERETLLNATDAQGTLSQQAVLGTKVCARQYTNRLVTCVNKWRVKQRVFLKTLAALALDHLLLSMSCRVVGRSRREKARHLRALASQSRKHQKP